MKGVPLTILKDWHTTLNGKYKSVEFNKFSRKKFWWKCHNKKCGHNWKDTLYSRVKLNNGCPKCKQRLENKNKKEFFGIKENLEKIINSQLEIDKSIDVFIDDSNSRYKRIKTSIKIRKGLEKIRKASVKLRESILKHKQSKLV